MLREIASLEWAATEVTYEPWIEEEAPLQLSCMSPEVLAKSSFQVDPGVRFVCCEHLIEDLWIDRHTEASSCEKPATDSRSWILVRRGVGGEIRFSRMNAGEKMLWEGLASQKTLLECCESLADSEEAVAALAELGRWTQNGLIKKILKDSLSLNDED